MIHLGIIPDGNRRWTRKNERGMDEVLEILIKMFMNSFSLENSKDYVGCLKEIGEISIYVLSKDNMKRTDKTMEMIRNGLSIIKSNKDVLDQLNIDFVGELTLLPDDIQETCKYIKSNCNQKTSLRLTAAIAYDPVDDLKKLCLDDPTRPKQNPIDMVIRTGGELRSSGFFPMHTLYSEWFYLEKLWPDITIKDLEECVTKFKARDRRYGK